jgi:hypothetical protein
MIMGFYLLRNLPKKAITVGGYGKIYPVAVQVDPVINVFTVSIRVQL